MPPAAPPATVEGSEPMSSLGSIPPIPIVPARRHSVLGPLHEPLFRTLWIAALVSYTGTWMQNVGAGWLMTSLTMSPLMVGLVQAAGSIAVFLVVLPAGAIADVVDRRKLLLLTQTWMVARRGWPGCTDDRRQSHTVAAVDVYAADGLWRCAQRSRLAGHHAGDCLAQEFRRRNRAELRRIQRRAFHRSRTWRSGNRRSRVGNCVPAERALVLWRHLFPVSVETQARTHVDAARPYVHRDVRGFPLPAHLAAHEGRAGAQRGVQHFGQCVAGAVAAAGPSLRITGLRLVAGLLRNGRAAGSYGDAVLPAQAFG